MLDRLHMKAIAQVLGIWAIFALFYFLIAYFVYD